MKPTLLDTSVCIQLLRDRPCKHADKVIAREDELYISAVTAYELFKSVSKLPEQEQKDSFAIVESFIARFQWIELDYPLAKKAGQRYTSALDDLSYPLGLNVLTAITNGLTLVVASTVSLPKELAVPGLDLEIW
jgi:predicted nucleic acid-binding protein